MTEANTLARGEIEQITGLTTNNLDAYWMPFTANRQFKKDPRLLVKAKDMHYTSADGRQILDGTAGLWCCNAGHGRQKIVEAVQQQVAELDYAPAFQMAHPKSFELAARLAALMPDPLNHGSTPTRAPRVLRQPLRWRSLTTKPEAKAPAPV